MKKEKNIRKLGLLMMLTIFSLGVVGQDSSRVLSTWVKKGETVTAVYNPQNVLKYRNSIDPYIFDVGIIKDSISPKSISYRIYATSNFIFDNPYFAFGIEGKAKATLITPYGDYKMFETPTYRGLSVNGTDTFPYVECQVSKELLKLFNEGKIKNISIYHTWNKEDHGDPIIKCGNYFKDFVTKY